MTLSTCTRATLLAAVLLAGCEDARIGGAPDGADDERTRAAYTREMIFIAEDATAAALLDFSAADVGSAVRRRAAGWAEAGSGWTPLYDLSWQGTPVRQPWRLVPQGPMRLRVGLNDEVEAVLVRDGDSDLAVLEHGDFIGAWAPHPAAQIVLREASLALGADAIQGWLVDARFGVTAAAEAQEQDAGGDAPDDVEAEAPAAAQTAQQDSVGGLDSLENDDPAEADVEDLVEAEAPRQTTPPARAHIRSVRAVLVAEDGETLVIGQTDAGLSAWLYTDDGERTLSGVTLTGSPGDRETWSLEAGGADPVTGTFTVMDEEPMPVAPRIVRGTVRVGAESLDMHGVLRPQTP